MHSLTSGQLQETQNRAPYVSGSLTDTHTHTHANPVSRIPVNFAHTGTLSHSAQLYSLQEVWRVRSYESIPY